MASNLQLDLTLPANKENLACFLGAVTGLAEGAGLQASRIQMVELVTEEALVNVMDYAYPEGDGSITLSAQWTPSDGLVLTITDQGTPFDVLSAPPPDLNLAADQRPIGGLGIHFIKKIAAKVTYARTDGRNVLTIVFAP